MGKLKCEKCGTAFATIWKSGTLYCDVCIPKKSAGCTCGCKQPTEATSKEKKSRWERLKDWFIDGYANYGGPYI